MPLQEIIRSSVVRNEDYAAAKGPVWEDFSFQFESEVSFSKPLFENSMSFFTEPSAVHEWILGYLQQQRSYKEHSGTTGET